MHRFLILDIMEKKEKQKFVGKKIKEEVTRKNEKI